MGAAPGDDVIALSRLTTGVLIRLNEMTNHSLVLPLLIFYPTSRCNSRCVSCDWWKSTGADDLTLPEIAVIVRELPTIGTRRVAFSGGEPLVRPDLFDVARLFLQAGVRLHLLSNGLLLQRHAEDVARMFDQVTISLDGATPDSYHAIRGVTGLAAIEAGVAALKAIAPKLRVTARATIHAANFRELPRLVDQAKALRLDGISFLAADLSSDAFGRPPRPAARSNDNGRRGGAAPAPRVRRPRQPESPLALDARQIAQFGAVIARLARDYAGDFASGFIAERPEKLRRLPRYYAALRGERRFPRVSCNAPWVSAVLEANGAVRPCFFHQPIGNVREKPLAAIIRSDLPAFRRALDVATHPLCQRCVCSLNAGVMSPLWQ